MPPNRRPYDAPSPETRAPAATSTPTDLGSPPTEAWGRAALTTEIRWSRHQPGSAGLDDRSEESWGSIQEESSLVGVSAIDTLAAEAPQAIPLGATPGLPPNKRSAGDAASSMADRYEDHGLLGMGGMGEVRRVYDPSLERMIAMKLIRRDRQRDPQQLRRFAQEAAATAQLAHPGIVPVYEQGVTDDGRPWFTMQEVRGETLSALITQLHSTAGARSLGRRPPPPGFRRLVADIERAARTVSFAHSIGVVHQDLKPANLLVGDHGEVMVVDWGLARAAGDGHGGVQGTPSYMAPEQARGAAVDPKTDVYGLGLLLWELCAGHPPFPGVRVEDVLELLRRGEVPTPPLGPWLIPEDLVTTMREATASDPARRPRDGAAFADRLRAWLDGETARERARALVDAATAIGESVRDLRRRADQLRQDAQRQLAASQPWEPESTRTDAWEVEDRANDLTRQVAVAEREVEAKLEAALIHDPDALDAHLLLARRLRSQQDGAEQEGQPERAAALELRLRRHLNALPPEHPERVQAESWLQGDGWLSLLTEPPDATVELSTFALARRRLLPSDGRQIGTSPLDKERLPQGSWLLTLRAPGRVPVNYPVFIRRQAHWDGRHPGRPQAEPIYLPREGEIGPDDCYVPAGWTELGGDPLAPSSLPACRVWVEGFVMRRFPVTNREYIEFLNHLAVTGDGDQAERYAPRSRGGSVDAWGEHYFGRSKDGTFHLQTDADGVTWHPDWPVIMVDHVAAWAYARWVSSRTGRPWRLPVEEEWEKAARGVDRRACPWGDFADPTWSNNRRAWPGVGKMEAVGTRPSDRSLYGVQDLSGNVVEWTASRMSHTGNTPDGGVVEVLDGRNESEQAWLGRSATWRVVGKGASRLHDLATVRSAFRLAMEPWTRASNVGIRLVFSLGSTAQAAAIRTPTLSA